jgi:4-diphosphocytidyl-2-C-methyl-D-erythritol kinase
MEHLNPPLVTRSFAKVNLYLRVVSRRRDGFHDLDTLFSRIDLHDTITIKGRKDSAIRISCSQRGVPAGKTNLCFRAAEALRKEAGFKAGLDIDIEKRIPVGAGLGGGSSNAASVLLGLNKYWHLNLSTGRLARLASGIGSDVAFFVHDAKFARGSGKGDKIRELPRLKNRRLWFVLACPRIEVSTPFIYRKFDISRLTSNKPDVKILLSELSEKGCRFDPKLLFNDLEAVTTSLYPVVSRVKDAFFAEGAGKVMMSGSGPTVFSICNCRAQAEDLNDRLRKKHKSWRIFLSSSI